MVNDLREDLTSGNLHFVMQGKYSNKRELIGAELLCRWNNVKHGFVSPAVFIPMIEKHGMEHQLGLLAIENAIKYIQSLGDLEIKIPFSVNICPSQLLDPNFTLELQQLLISSEVDPSLLELEVTESIFINDSDSTNNQLADLKALGVSLSLDDFGTGYSSLSYLGKYNFDVIKIDRSFVMDIDKDQQALKLFSAIMNICKAFDFDVVVEGIETEDQFTLLNLEGVEKYQGFLLGKPSSLDDFINHNNLGNLH